MNLKHRFAFPRISTRGYYDLHTGKRLSMNDYFLYPKSKMDKIYDVEQIVIFVHGMRNTRYGAKKGADILRRRLRQLGYQKHPVVVFSYDADVRGAHLEKNYHKVLKTAYKIAKANGIDHLSKYIEELFFKNPNIKVHLVGHSLGCVVVRWTMLALGSTTIPNNGIIQSVHLFGSPLETKEVEEMSRITPVKKVVNYHNSTDEVIKEGVINGDLSEPSCLNPYMRKLPHLRNKKCLAKDHRFKSYTKKMKVFP